MKEYPIKTPKQLGMVLQGCRRASAITQSTLAERIGVAQSAISQMESDPSGSNLARILKILAALDMEVVIRASTEASPKEPW